MKFKPFGEKYSFDSDSLIEDFPRYFHDPIGDWLWKVLNSANVVDVDYQAFASRHKKYIKSSFLNKLQIYFREEFPHYWSEALPYIFENPNRTANLLALCLQNFADQDDADELEHILSKGGSAYEVMKTNKDASEYDKGAYDLMKRVSPAVKKQAELVLEEDELMREAWNYCYSRNPDYEKVVSRSCDFLENFLGQVYFPRDKKPQLKKFVYAFEKDASNLSYKGSSIVRPKNNLTDLLKNASDIRGQHTRGKGRKPTKEEAEFVLHTTIYIWNLHQSK